MTCMRRGSVVLVGCAMAAGGGRGEEEVGEEGKRRRASSHRKRKSRGYNLREGENPCVRYNHGWDSPSGEPTAECGWKSMVDDFVSAACVPSRISFRFVVEFEERLPTHPPSRTALQLTCHVSVQAQREERRSAGRGNQVRQAVRAAAGYDDGIVVLCDALASSPGTGRRTLLSLAETRRRAHLGPRFNLHVLLPDNVGFRDKMAQR